MPAARCQLETNRCGASLKAPTEVEMLATGTYAQANFVLYMVGSKEKFYCKKEFVVFVSSCTRNASFEGEKSIKDLVVFSSVLPRFISLSPLEGEMFDTVKTWMLAHVRRIIPSYHELAMMSSQLTCTSTIT